MLRLAVSSNGSRFEPRVAPEHADRLIARRPVSTGNDSLDREGQRRLFALLVAYTCHRLGPPPELAARAAEASREADLAPAHFHRYLHHAWPNFARFAEAASGRLAGPSSVAQE
jgi:hypothetical protein